MTDFQEYLEMLMRGNIHETENLVAAERESFTFPTARSQWAPPRHYAIEHLTIDWRMDLVNEHVDAITKLKIRSIINGLRRVTLHAAELSVTDVQDSKGEEVGWDIRPEDHLLTVYLNTPLAEGQSEELTFIYVIDHPRAGLYFTNPCPEFPQVETSAWTQMQDDFARFVLPIYDNPSHKFPVETIVTVPVGLYVMSNGVLKERKKNEDGTETFHWVQELPIPAYLITVAVSEYVEYKEDLEGLEVSYYAHKRWDRDTVYRSFGKTPDMIRFFQSRLGVKFPWAKYAQVTAANFIFGGMENASATTQTDATLHDAMAHLDFDSDGLVSHELAHMWVGDLVTCRTWSHGWLNEGGASQFQNEWKLHDRGYDEYLYDQYGKQMAYFDEDKNNYRRPIVCNQWEHGGDVFDAHLYPGAAWRYYMLKHLVGTERWWRILGTWLTRFAHKSVYTHDLESLVTEITGEDFGWFFDQWLYKAGYPECNMKCSYDDKLGQVQVKIEQTQKSDDGMTPEAFRFPLTVDIVTEDGERSRYTMEVTERAHSFYYRAPKKPKQITVDPDYTVLMDSKIEKPENMWIEQLHHGVNVVQRIRAAQALGNKVTQKAVEALGKALVLDTFWGVKAEIAKVLGNIKTESALDHLLKGVDVDSTKAKAAVARALGEFYRNDRAFEALKNMLHDKQSYFVCAAAAASIGKTRHDQALDVLSSELKEAPDSWHNLIRQGYIEGLVATGKEPAIAIIVEYAKLGSDDYLRRVIPGALATLGKRYKKEHPEVKDELAKLINDNSYRVKIAAILAAKTYEDASLIPVLSRVAEGAVESRIVRYSREAIRELSKKKEPKEIDSIKKSIEELEKENRDLKDRLTKVESRLEKESS